jgi:hypothetical protein
MVYCLSYQAMEFLHWLNIFPGMDLACVVGVKYPLRFKFAKEGSLQIQNNIKMATASATEHD